MTGSNLDRMSDGHETPPVIPVTRAQLFGEELTRLTRDDGGRLAEIIAELRHGVRVEPGNLIAINALVHALAYAGKAEEAHALAAKAYILMGRLPVVGPDTLLNVGAGLSEAGRVAEAKACYERALAQAPIPGLAGNMMNLAVRFGETDWLKGFWPEHPFLAFLERHDLTDWAEQQRSVELVLARRVATFHATITDFHDGTERLVIDYFTETVDPDRLELEEEVWTALEEHYQYDPRGPGALMGVAIINVHGPEIPLP